MRAIGDRSYTVKQSITDGEEQEEMIETKMDDVELENFKNEWEEKLNLSIREAWNLGVQLTLFKPNGGPMLNPFN